MSLSGHSLSIRSKKSDGGSKHHFSMSSLRGMRQPELSKKLYALIKNANHAISAHESASKEGKNVANQISEWGESTEDDAVSDISDKLAVLLSEIAEQENSYAENLEESRAILKQIRDIEASVAPTRQTKSKIQDEIQKLKYKEPESTKIPQLEQELVRAEAQSLVAEAQLTNITRQKFKEAFDIQTAAVIERAEKQIILAQYSRQLLNLLDDTPIVPGEERQPFAQEAAAREILNQAEDQLKSAHAEIAPIESSANKVGNNALGSPVQTEQSTIAETAAPIHAQQSAAAPVATHTATPASVDVAHSSVPSSEVTGNAALAS